jgi:hypothetical protein
MVMKASVNDQVITLQSVVSDFTNRVIPRGTLGTVVERYEHPTEGYAVDLAVPDDELVGGFRYENIILQPDQFDVVTADTPDGSA